MIYEAIDRWNTPSLLHYGVKGMKWGIRHDRQNSGRSVYRKAIKMEPKITKDISDSITRNGGQVYGLDHRLKTEGSIARKLSLGKEIKDAVRYTAILSEKDFVSQYNGIKKDLEGKGYTETRCKNYFEQYRKGLVKHKSVQTNYKTRDGYTFELQFQTKASQNAKDKKVPLYEESRDPKTSAKRRNELIRQMEVLANKVNDPIGIDRIKEH